ncbi:5'/3'-nucleotidase SurE [Clostridium malenominatum]|uniref:5'-nucleotidase SurE n=1 Tax=Clostridium malenominatum TaxID=1539 RepID=A0ABN1J1Z7_9CLOT
MRLLLANDDGIDSIALQILARELQKEHEVLVVAPSSQRSAASHSITIHNSLIVKEVTLPGIVSKAYSVDGTPADCVRIALDKLISSPVDMVISGTNIGANLGRDILYSGTVSAAVEAAINKIPSIAVSCEINFGEPINEEHFLTAAKYVSKVIEIAKSNLISNDMVLNVNVPAIEEKQIKGIQVSPMGGDMYNFFYNKTLKEDGTLEFSLSGKHNEDIIENTDVYYIKNGYVTITPLHYDFTNFRILNEVKGWF